MFQFRIEDRAPHLRDRNSRSWWLSAVILLPAHHPAARWIPDAGPGDIEILPVDPGYVYVPFYNPYVVYARPRPGFFVGGAITFGPRIVVGAFAPWGWGHSSFVWRDHRIIVNNRPWERTWVNRQSYEHRYEAPRPPAVDHRTERHELREYRPPERREFERGHEGERGHESHDGRRRTLAESRGPI